MFNLFFKAIDRDAKIVINGVLDWWRERFFLDHQVNVYCFPSHVVTDSVGGFGFAAFIPDPDNLRIGIGGLQTPDLDRSDWLHSLEECLFHELAHYWQYREGFPFDEEMAERFARQWHKDYPGSPL